MMGKALAGPRSRRTFRVRGLTCRQAQKDKQKQQAWWMVFRPSAKPLGLD